MSHTDNHFAGAADQVEHDPKLLALCKGPLMDIEVDLSLADLGDRRDDEELQEEVRRAIMAAMEALGPDDLYLDVEWNEEDDDSSTAVFIVMEDQNHGSANWIEDFLHDEVKRVIRQVLNRSVAPSVEQPGTSQ